MKNVEVASNSTLTLSLGKHTSVKMHVGQHYQVRKPGKVGDADNANDLQVPDNLIATRRGDTLHLRYADGSTADFEDFYRLCKEASVCSVNVASDNDAGITLGADNAGGGVTTADDGTLVYAHGSNDVLMSMAEGQVQLIDTLSMLGTAPMLTYLPQYAEAAYFAAFALGGTNLLSASTTPALASSAPTLT